jgi:probable rRNA maturation factor
LKIHYEGYFYRIEKFALENAKKEFLNYFEISENFIFYLHSVSEQQSISFNQHYFKKDTPADVLTVPLYKNFDEINKLDKNNVEILGDLFIYRKLIKHNALKYKKTMIEELQLVLIHGLLHLVGFSHENEDRLKKIENKMLEKVWKNAK